ncbi:MAG: CBS domain-containing protein [Rhodanobacteraceae bacterium]|nr:MAG: CBS domain-containing protein [Rhodanobacteraceae bacterium]
MPLKSTLVTHRILLTSGLAIVLGAAAAAVAQLLMLLINVITDICFYGGKASVFAPVHQAGIHSSTFVLQPTTAYIGAWVIVMPVIGGLIAGVMARWGSRAIQGHGIPEAMEQILEHESNIPPRVTWLKPVSSAFAIGTGGPFGAEGPIISTGGALGSLIGQFLRVTAQERKVLLAAGAAAGMAAVFGAPVASVAMAVELLLFELRPRSLIPVALATVVATGVRYVILGPGAVFAMPQATEPTGTGLMILILLGLVVGYASVWVTRSVYFVEDMFAKLPVHWMWWPAIGAIAAGVIGFFEPATLGVGYSNIDRLVQNGFAGAGLGALFAFGLLKFVSWSVSLGSGTSGGTLAPLFMIGGSMGALIAMGLNDILPSLHLSVGIAALVGMGAMFAGSSRALLTAVIFCFETTRQPATFLPLLGGCAAAYLISAMTMKNTIMTEKIERRGVRVPSEYVADALAQVKVGAVCTRDVRSLKTSDELGEVQRWLQSGRERAQHQGYPVLDDAGRIRGVVTRRELFSSTHARVTRVGDLLTRGPIVVFEEHSLRDASDLMVAENVGRLVVVDRNNPTHMVGVLTRSDVLAANAKRIHEMRDVSRHIRIRQSLWHFGGHPHPGHEGKAP